jgi:hypothetical protein
MGSASVRSSSLLTGIRPQPPLRAYRAPGLSFRHQRGRAEAGWERGHFTVRAGLGKAHNRSGNARGHVKNLSPAIDGLSLPDTSMPARSAGVKPNRPPTRIIVSTQSRMTRQ